MDGHTEFLTTLQTYFEHFRGIPEPRDARNPSLIGSNFRKALKASRLSVINNYAMILDFVEKDREYATRMVTAYTVREKGCIFHSYGVNYFRTLYFLCKSLQHYVEGRPTQANRSINSIFINLRNARMIADTG